MSFTRNVAAAALVCALTFGGAAFCQAAGDGAPNGPNYGQDLTPQQWGAARKIFDENYASLNATRQALTQKRAELDNELASATPDRAKVEALSREIGELRGKMLAGRLEVRNQLEKQGLPPDCFGPGREPQNGYMPGPGWHNRRHHGGHGWSGRGWNGRGWGCMGGCPWY